MLPPFTLWNWNMLTAEPWSVALWPPSWILTYVCPIMLPPFTWWSWNMLSLERATAAILAITGRLWITKVTSFFYKNLNYNYYSLFWKFYLQIYSW
jgi:hypothetical protein